MATQWTDPEHYKGTWIANHQPSVLPGWTSGSDMEKTADYIDENGENWQVEAYNPTDSAFPTDRDYHWRANIANTKNRYGLDPTLPTISGSESQYKLVAAIDVWVEQHKAKPSTSGAGILWLIALVALALSDKRKH